MRRRRCARASDTRSLKNSWALFPTRILSLTFRGLPFQQPMVARSPPIEPDLPLKRYHPVRERTTTRIESSFLAVGAPERQPCAGASEGGKPRQEAPLRPPA